MKVLFLDIDGVLNGHDWDAEAGSCYLDRECVKRLSRIVRETDAVIVISSSWRYMVLGGTMTLDGFCYMLRTHGLTALAKVIGTTKADEEFEDRDDRAQQITAWMRGCKERIESFVVLDDMRLNGFGARQIQTCSRGGITDSDADRAIQTLNNSTT